MQGLDHPEAMDILPVILWVLLYPVLDYTPRFRQAIPRGMFGHGNWLEVVPKLLSFA